MTCSQIFKRKIQILIPYFFCSIVNFFKCCKKMALNVMDKTIVLSKLIETFKGTTYLTTFSERIS